MTTRRCEVCGRRVETPGEVPPDMSVTCSAMCALEMLRRADAGRPVPPHASGGSQVPVRKPGPWTKP